VCVCVCVCQVGDVVTLEATNREFSSVDQLVGMLNLVPAEMDAQQREALDLRRRAAAQQRAEVKRREQQREQQAFKAQAEEEAEKKRLADAKRQAQNLIEKQRREADEAQQRELDEKRKRLESMPKEVSPSSRTPKPNADRLFFFLPCVQDPTHKSKQYASANRFQLHEIREIEAVFADLDSGGFGGFVIGDVARAFQQMGEEVSQQDLEQFMMELDPSRQGAVRFGAFLDAVDKLPPDAIQFPPPNSDPNPMATNNIALNRSANNVPQIRRAISPPTRY
jgi:flagellar biosynthesis GTPase FlhF